MDFFKIFSGLFFRRTLLASFKGLLFPSVLVFLAACSGGGGGEFANLENQGGADADKVPCSITSLTPAEDATTKVASASGTKTLISANLSTSSCKSSFFLNGVKLESDSKPYVEIDSNLLVDGDNTVRVEVQNDYGSDFALTTIKKNILPSCSRTSPSLGNLNLTVGPQTFTVNGTVDSDETASFSWVLNGSSSANLTEVISGASASQGSLDITGLPFQVHTVSGVVSDGLDSVSCDWTVNVGVSCEMTAQTPATGPKVSAAASTATTFNVSTTSASCLVAWQLNGVELSGTSSTRTVLSSEMSPGLNTLRAVMTTSSGSTQREWIVRKNLAPTCSQTPASSGSSVSVGQTLNLVSTMVDGDADVVTPSWLLNETASFSGAILNTSTGIDGGGNPIATGAFTPTEPLRGNNIIKAILNDGYDATTCTWNVSVNPSCQIASKFPSGTTLTIPQQATYTNVFNAFPNDGSCSVSWYMDGVNTGSILSIQNLASSIFGGTTALKVRISNASSFEEHTWTVTKNSPPICGVLSPTTPTQIRISTNTNFQTTMSDSDAHSLTGTWKLNGVDQGASAYFTPSVLGTTFTGAFSPLSSHIGNNTLLLAVTDSYDTTNCSWTAQVKDQCSITSKSPTGTSFRAPYLSSYSNPFFVVANSSDCTITWKLNSSTIATGNNAQNILSSAMSGSNTVEAIVDNGVSSATATWTVTKNNPPICSLQAPSSNGNTLNFGDYLDLSSTWTDGDADNLLYSWKWNSNSMPSGTVSNEVSSNSPSKTAAIRFTPGLSQVGLGHVLQIESNDGYDSQTCTWALDVMDPNSAQVIAWSPLDAVVRIASTGSQYFSVSATGTGNVYTWKLNGSTVQTGASSSYDMTSGVVSGLGTGNHTLVVTVVDTYGNDDSKTFNIRKNAPPTVASFIPNVNGVTNYKVNLTGSLQFTVNATDSNAEDTLTYSWVLSNSAIPELAVDGGGDNIANLIPDSNTSLLGTKIVKVTISDGLESTTKTWDVNINNYSDECNTLYNGSPTGGSGGRICTLVGNPSTGHGDDISIDMAKLKTQPWTYIEIEPNLYAIADYLNHAIIILNKTGSTVSRFNQSISNNTAKVVLGMGAPGFNSNGNVYAFDTQDGKSIPVFKLNSPRGLAYDSVNRVLYISDSGNHRVVAIDSTGYVMRVLGLPDLGTTNAAAQNVEGEDGPSHVCIRPVGLKVASYGGIRYLWAACASSYTIKKVNIQTPTTNFTGGNTYLDTTTAVGRMATSAGATAIASRDGLAGYTTGSGATAQVATPWDLDLDNNGNLYWSEKHNGSAGLRVRMLNTTASPITIVPADTARMAHTQSLLAFQIEDMALTSSNPQPFWNSVAAVGSRNSLNPASLSSAVVNKMVISVPAYIRNNANCVPVYMTAQDSGSANVRTSADVILTPEIRKVSDSTLVGGAATFYASKANCDSASSAISNVTLSTGEFDKLIWMKMNTSALDYKVRVSGTTTFGDSGAIKLQTAALTTTATGATAINNAYTLSVPATMSNASCIPLTIYALNGTTLAYPATAGTDKKLRLRHNNLGTFYSDENCSSIIDSVNFTNAAQDYYKVVYYNRAISVPSGYTASLLGFENLAAGTWGEYGGGANTPATCTTCRNIGDMRIASGGNSYGSNNQAGIAVSSNGSGNINGLFIADERHVINYANFDSSDTYLGTQLLKSYSVVMVVGKWNGSYYDGMYNGSNQAGHGSALRSPRDIEFNLDKTKLLIADTDNLFGRYLEICSGGSLCKIQDLFSNGEARGRSGSLASAATEAILNGPFKLDIKDNYLYFTESLNHRIRKMNLATGVLESIAGVGYFGTTPTFPDNTDKDLAYVIYPRGFKVMDWPSSVAPTHQVLLFIQGSQFSQYGATTPNGSCLVRAVNMSSTVLDNFYGKTILPGKVVTIAGDTMNGCGTWSSLPNVEGGVATDNRLNSPEDIAIIGGEIYVTNSADNCFVKIDTNGFMTRPQGTGSCSTTAPGSATNGSMTAVTTRIPFAFAPDPENSNNYLFSDFSDVQTGYIRYINNTTLTNIPFRSAVPGKASEGSPPVLSQFFSENAGSANTSRVNGIAVWNDPNDNKYDWVCYATGLLFTDYWNPVPGTNIGDHYVKCEPRNCLPGVGQCPATQTIGNPTLGGVGKPQSGAPISREQEGIDKALATLYSPTGLVFDSEGNLYISDYGNHIIRMVRKWW